MLDTLVRKFGVKIPRMGWGSKFPPPPSPTAVCFYEQSAQSINASFDTLKAMAEDTSAIASELAKRLQEKPKLLEGVARSNRSRRMEDLHTCREEISSMYSALNSSIDAICMTDIRGRVLFANDKFLQLYGMTPKELLGTPISVVGAGKTPKEVYKDMWSTILSSKIWTGVVENRNKSTGEVIEVESSIIPIHSSKKVPDYFVCVQTPTGEEYGI